MHKSCSAHYSDVIIGAMASQITGVSIICSTVCSGADQREHQMPGSLDSARGIHRWPVVSPRKGPVTRKMFPFDDVIVIIAYGKTTQYAMHFFPQISYSFKNVFTGEVSQQLSRFHIWFEMIWCRNVFLILCPLTLNPYFSRIHVSPADSYLSLDW